jgi:hypothetical protein
MAASTSAEIQEANESQNRELVLQITHMLDTSEPPFSPLSPGFCIYRVPQDLRKLNDKAYTPMYICINRAFSSWQEKSGNYGKS